MEALPMLVPENFLDQYVFVAVTTGMVLAIFAWVILAVWSSC